jgi:glycosyltransferase involved in cell wall biosynthesis
MASVCCPVSQVLADRVVAAGVPVDRILVRHNGIDPDRFHAGRDRELAKASLGLQGKCVLGFVGFLRDWHRVDRVVRVLADGVLPQETHLLIAGDGPALPALKALCRDLQVESRVTFLGLVHWRDVPGVLAAFDIALQPAVTDYASPLKLIEYLACGLPVVAPGQENIRELIDDGANGWILRDNSVKGLSEALLALCLDLELRARLGVAAAQTIQRRGLTWTENARAVVARIAVDVGRN